MTTDEDDELPPWETVPEWVFARRVWDEIHNDRFDDAKRLIEEMRKEFPHMESHEFIRFYAAIVKRLGDPERAIEMLQQAVSEKPDYISHHFRLGTELVEAGRWEEADPEFHEVIDLSLATDDPYYLNARVTSGLNA